MKLATEWMAMKRRRGCLAAASAIVLATACSGSSGSPGRAARAAAPMQRAASTTTVPARPFVGTGMAHLRHAGPGGVACRAALSCDGFVEDHGTVTSVLLGRGTYYEYGKFTGPGLWRSKVTLTAADGDTVTLASVGGIQSVDAKGVAHSATTQTITGGTGRFAGATGTTKTTGSTYVRPGDPAQIYAFKFTGTIRTKP